MVVEVDRELQHEIITYARTGAVTNLTGAFSTSGFTSLASSETVVFESADTMMSEMRQSGSRTLHLANWPHRSPWAEHAVTATGPSIAWMTSATEMPAAVRRACSRPRTLLRGQEAAAGQAFAAPWPSTRSGSRSFPRFPCTRGPGPEGQMGHRDERVIGFLR